MAHGKRVGYTPRVDKAKPPVKKPVRKPTVKPPRSYPGPR